MPDDSENGCKSRGSKELAEIIEEIEFNRRKITELIERNEVLEQRKAEVWCVLKSVVSAVVYSKIAKRGEMFV